jgi:tetratricopeptide (TPR) repeat protein
LQQAFAKRGLALYALGRLEEAVASYDRALALHPGDAATLVNRGLALAGLRRPAEALPSPFRR